MTLIELAIAILILSLATVAAFRATDQASRGIAGTEERMLAGIVAENRMQELQLYATGQPLPQTVTMGRYEFELTQETKRTAGGLIRAEVVARSSGGAGALLVGYLPIKGTQ